MVLMRRDMVVNLCVVDQTSGKMKATINQCHWAGVKIVDLFVSYTPQKLIEEMPLVGANFDRNTRILECKPLAQCGQRISQRL
jgi:hypothetical protein